MMSDFNVSATAVATVSAGMIFSESAAATAAESAATFLITSTLISGLAAGTYTAASGRIERNSGRLRLSSQNLLRAVLSSPNALNAS